MNAEQLTARLAEQAMGWTSAPDRFLLGNRKWIPRWRFQPLSNFEHAFQLLEKAASSFTLASTTNGTFTVRVRVGDHIGIASGELKAAAITVAVARAIGIDVPEDVLLSSVTPQNSRGEGRKQ